MSSIYLLASNPLINPMCTRLGVEHINVLSRNYTIIKVEIIEV